MQIPVEPVAADGVTQSRGNSGITLQGVVIAEAAPVDAILGAYTIASFDDCGGHFNPVEGYHLHGELGWSSVGGATEGDTAMFGYAMDGFAVFSPFEEGEEPDDLDECNGHTTDDAGYHYHANRAEKNDVITCLTGQTASSGDAAGGAGPPGGGAPPADGGAPPADGGHPAPGGAPAPG
ncbi:MAG: YHYH protein [Microthrixaceae bacterium]